MNKQRLLALADHLDRLEHTTERTHPHEGHFNLDYITFGYECETPACIAGHVEAIWGSCDYSIGVMQRAGKMLDLDRLIYLELFDPHIPGREEITPQHAAKVLRHYVATGIVDWDLEEEIT